MRTRLTNNSSVYLIGKIKYLGVLAASCPQRLATFWRQNWYHKAIVAGMAAGALAIGLMYGIGQWYIWSQRNVPFSLGTSFIADYAAYLGLDPHQTFLAELNDLHVRSFRLVSYWSDIEAEKGKYNFSELDWEFQQANSHGAKISLAVGLRQPRWPECHMPGWAESEPASSWEPQLLTFMTAVVNRYKTNPALQSYQLENEYFLTAFTRCADESRSRLITESNLVRHLDPNHTLIIARSNNAIGWPIGPPNADEYGLSIYKRTWSPVINRYIEYPFPAWYYAFLAGAEKLGSGRNTMIHELQAEPWPPHSAPIPNTSLAEQDKTFTAARLQQMVAFGKATGMKSAYLWGAEYWYYRAEVLHDASAWNAARQEFANQ